MLRVLCFASTFVASLAAELPGAAAQCVTGGPGGAITGTFATAGVWDTTLPGVAFTSSLAVTVPAGATVLNSVKLNGLAHTWSGDLHVVLRAPNLNLYNILIRSDSTSSGAAGCADDFGGDYEIVDPLTGGPSCGVGNPAMSCSGLPIATGTYIQQFSTWTSGNAGLNNTPIESIPIASGTWTLYIYDWYPPADNGSLASWDLCFGSPTTPPVFPLPGVPTQASPADTSTVSSPVTLTWTAASCATQHSIEVDGIVYGPQYSLGFTFAGAVGSHTWRVRGENATGVGAWSTTWTFYFPWTPAVCTELTTLFAGGNGGNNGGQIFFDMTVSNPAGITLGEIAINTGEANGFTLDVYTKPTTYVGFTNNLGAWTLLTSGPGIGAGFNQPSYADVTDVLIPAGMYGVALVLSASHGFDYTNGYGGNQNYSNADLSLSLGAANNVPWTGTALTPRVFNGIIRYNCVGASPVPYCTAGTSTNGCVPSIMANHQPSVAQSNPCNIAISNVEGMKFGIVFYGINQTGFTPSAWAVGGTSFLCVKGPTQRTGTGSSGGTLNQCNGTLSLDWNAYQTANPGSVGNPWFAGDKVYVQGWYRDPPAPKTTNLTNALEMTYQP